MKIITVSEATQRKSELLKELANLNNIIKNPVSIMDRVKTFEDCLDIKGITKVQFDKRVKGLDKDTVAYEKLKIIVQVLNEGKVLDWTNSNQYKYYPYFMVGDSSGSGFACDGYDNRNTHSYVASRLCFHSEELAVFAGKTFYITNQ